ncbi:MULTISPECIES: hypothetical protein [Okeania]|uniref:hypothetical protein n=1 Tax=Okeania TaxID=1458928 RepID=UPI001374A08B|nr:MULTISPECIES: hypothetical protein [Okeania]NEP08636.1 hypothetical protein [Okeania sp. SIO4D6]NEP41506.1 hypothetical protein [Okeania sp. SIO2H7]NET17190.1 hypothetical protein [Okeania sp. SIO1H6]NEP71538.1 hypothetical protein [Okeania sp. SIO2G5]NEP96036.1 hypothetical protein [Okeania sp. SIO2F5]
MIFTKKAGGRRQEAEGSKQELERQKLKVRRGRSLSINSKGKSQKLKVTKAENFATVGAVSILN